jgi:hypothetical protein
MCKCTMFLRKNELETDSNQLVHKKLTYIIRMISLKSFSKIFGQQMRLTQIYIPRKRKIFLNSIKKWNKSFQLSAKK